MIRSVTLLSSALFVCYCVYFDWKRHQDPDFKKKLAERRLKLRQAEIKEKKSVPIFKSMEEKQMYMIRKIDEGERLMMCGQTIPAIDSYCKALIAADGSAQLFQMFSGAFPPEIFQLVVNKYRELTNSQVD